MRIAPTSLKNPRFTSVQSGPTQRRRVAPATASARTRAMTPATPVTIGPFASRGSLAVVLVFARRAGRLLVRWTTGAPTTPSRSSTAASTRLDSRRPRATSCGRSRSSRATGCSMSGPGPASASRRRATSAPPRSASTGRWRCCRSDIASSPRSACSPAQVVDLPFRDRTFDVVMGNFVLAHFVKVETALFDVRRVLRPAGRVGFTAWADRRTRSRMPGSSWWRTSSRGTCWRRPTRRRPPATSA